jgi:hypothetical protein
MGTLSMQIERGATKEHENKTRLAHAKQMKPSARVTDKSNCPKSERADYSQKRQQHVYL